jgi:hypothetical protein
VIQLPSSGHSRFVALATHHPHVILARLHGAASAFVVGPVPHYPHRSDGTDAKRCRMRLGTDLGPGRLLKHNIDEHSPAPIPVMKRRFAVGVRLPGSPPRLPACDGVYQISEMTTRYMHSLPSRMRGMRNQREQRLFLRRFYQHRRIYKVGLGTHATASLAPPGVPPGPHAQQPVRELQHAGSYPRHSEWPLWILGPGLRRGRRIGPPRFAAQHLTVRPARAVV